MTHRMAALRNEVRYRRFTPTVAGASGASGVQEGPRAFVQRPRRLYGGGYGATVPMLDETPLSSCTPEQQVHLGLAQVYVSVFVISSHVAHDNPIACLEATLHFDEVTGALPNIHFDLRRAPPVGIEHEQSPFCIRTTCTQRGFFDVDHVSQPARG